MAGRDDDSRSDLDRWYEKQREEIDKVRRQFQDSFNRELKSWDRGDNDSSASSQSSYRGPFERFKSFVDSNLNTFSEGFKNFPSNISELKARMQAEREARREEEASVWECWTGSTDSPDHIKMQVERQTKEEQSSVKDATYMLLRQAYERNKHVPSSKILQLYRDNEWKFGSLDQFATPMLSMGGACYYKTESIENLPSTARWGWPTPKPQWLSVDWFKRSPYSPIRLEVDPDLEPTELWRPAFEDLLCAALDKPMISEEKVGQRIPYGKPQSTYWGPGLDWMLSLQCRGILPPQLPSLYKPVSLFDGFDEVKRPRTVQFMHDMDQITSNNKSARVYPQVEKDIKLLMDEIAIKSCPETEAAPLNVIPQSPWQVPDTEQDLYDQMPPYTDLLTPPTAPDRKASQGLTVFESQAREFEKSEEMQRAIAEAAENVWQRLKSERNQSDDELEQGLAEYGRDPWERIRAENARAEKAREDEQAAYMKQNKIITEILTTKTTRLPDGSITEEYLQTTEFADGRKEITSGANTTQIPQGSKAGQRSEHAKQQDSEKATAKEENKKKGWFWS